MTKDRCIPDFIVIGAMRAGTTTLFHQLNNNPDIGMSRMKETDFFIPAMNYPLGLDWYRGQFDPAFPVCGEVSPNYTKHDLWKGVPARIKEALPQVRLIFLARDPVDRFVSHYLHSWHVGHSRVPPEDLLASPNGQHMLETSRYAAQITTYLAHFPKERILILDFAELRTDPQRTLDRVTDFLGLIRHPVARTVPRNEGASTAKLPGFVQRAWRSRTARRFDPFITREMRDRARRWMSVGPRRADPEIGAELRAAAAEQLAEDAAAFRRISGLAFKNWQV